MLPSDHAGCSISYTLKEKQRRVICSFVSGEVLMYCHVNIQLLKCFTTNLYKGLD